MKRLEKLALSMLAVVMALGCWSFASAGDITNVGWNQKDVVTYLTNVKTMCNEIKADFNLVFANQTALENLVNEQKTDYNALFSDYSGAKIALAELKADYNALFADYSGLKTSIEAAASFDNISATVFNMTASQTAAAVAAMTATQVTSTDAAGSATVVSTTDLTLSGL